MTYQIHRKYASIVCNYGILQDLYHQQSPPLYIEDSAYGGKAKERHAVLC